MFTVTLIYVILCLHLLHIIFTNPSPLWILLYNISQVGKLFNHFQKQSPEVFHKESHSQTFCNTPRKTPEQGSISNKVADHQACNFMKKRLQHRYFLANGRKFIRRSILKNVSEQQHYWKVFRENVFQIRSELSKRNYWWLAVWKVTQISQDWIKMLPMIKYYARRLNSLKKD